MCIYLHCTRLVFFSGSLAQKQVFLLLCLLSISIGLAGSKIQEPKLKLNPEDSTTLSHYPLPPDEKRIFDRRQVDDYFIMGRRAYANKEYEQATKLLIKGATLADESEYTAGAMLCYYWIARCYRRIANYANYQKYLALLLERANKLNDKEYRYFAYEGFGNLYRYLGDYPQSLENYMKAIELSESMGKLSETSTALNNMSLVYDYMGNTEEQLKLQLRNYEILQKIGEKPDLVLCLSNLSGIYADMNQYEKAGEYVRKALRIVEEEGENNIPFKDLAAAYSQYANYAMRQGNYSLALLYYGKGFELMKLNKDKKGVSDYYASLADVYSLMGKDKLAEELYLKQWALAKEMRYMNGRISACESLKKLKMKQGNYRSACAYLEEYALLKDSMVSEISAQKMAEAETRFKLKNQLQTIKLLYNNKSIQDLELQRRKIISYGLSIGLVLMLLIALFVFKSYRQKQISNKDLEKLVSKRTLELARKNQDMKDFIYKSSHDLRAPVASIKGLISLAKTDAEDPGKLRLYLDKMAETNDKQDNLLLTLLKMSKLIEGKVFYEKINLEALFNEIAEECKMVDNMADVVINIDVEKNLEIASDRVILSSIIQNLVSNGIKYRMTQTESSYVKVEAERKNKGLQIKVSDNGQGIFEEWKDKVFEVFTRATAHGSGYGIGLYIVRNSVELLGGTIHLESELRVGSTFTISLPDKLV